MLDKDQLRRREVVEKVMVKGGTEDVAELNELLG